MIWHYYMCYLHNISGKGHMTWTNNLLRISFASHTTKKPVHACTIMGVYESCPGSCLDTILTFPIFLSKLRNEKTVWSTQKNYKEKTFYFFAKTEWDNNKILTNQIADSKIVCICAATCPITARHRYGSWEARWNVDEQTCLLQPWLWWNHMLLSPGDDYLGLKSMWL